jgi:hypothetical protein
MPEGSQHVVAPNYPPLVVLLDSSWIMDLQSPQGRNFGVVTSFLSPKELAHDDAAVQTIGGALYENPADFAARARLGSETINLLVPANLPRFPKGQALKLGPAQDICDRIRGRLGRGEADLDELLKMLDFAERDFRIDFEVALPSEVKQEIGRNLRHPQKAAPARNARVVFAELLESHFFREIDLASVPRVEMNETLLGPDSDVDKGLVSYAVHRASEGANVCLATNDGGILAECASLCAKKKVPIFTPLNWNNLENLYTRRFEQRLQEFEGLEGGRKKWWKLA